MAAIRVVPAVPTFAVDDGFWYSLTSEQESMVEVGSMVRVPLGGRKVRGFVVELGVRAPARLRPIAALSMKVPVFDPVLLAALDWAANRYVAPRSVLLERAAPPNLVNRVSAPKTSTPGTHPPGGPLHLLTAWAKYLGDGKRRPPVAFLGGWWDMDWVEAVAGPVLEAGKSVMVIAATGQEVTALAERARKSAGADVVAVSPDMSDAEITGSWAACQTGGVMLVGTPRVASWQLAELGVAVIVEEGRKAMKDRQTPTVSVRDLMKTRSALAGFGLGFVGPTPTLETIAAGATVIRPRRRAWPPVEIVDRREQAPTHAVVGGVALAAIKAVAARGGLVFVFAHRRGYAPASRCERCRTLRRCPQCGSRPELAPTCQRCGATLGPCVNCGHDRFVPVGAGVGRVTEELRRSLGGAVGVAPSEDQIQVGSEADLAGLGRQDLVVAVDPDGLILGSHYRAAEEALRILARLVGRVRGSGSRGLIQTYIPDHPVLVALRTGDPISFLSGELETRARFGLPPSGQLLVLEIRGEGPPDLEAAIRTAVPENVSVLGPDLRRGVNRFLLQANDLGATRLVLRPLVQKWREGGATVRIDADPFEL